MSFSELDEIPAFLQTLAKNPRNTIRRTGPSLKHGRCIVYWMQRAQRSLDNPALNLAITVGNEFNLPVIAFFSVIASYPHANLRHYAFLSQALSGIEEELAQRNVQFIIRRPPNNSLEKFLAEVNAAMLIGDENHCREPERWRKVLSKRLDMPFWTVDADVIVPSSLFPKHQYMLHIMRPGLNAELPHYLMPSENPKADRLWQRPRDFDSFPANHDITYGWKQLDRSVSPVDTFTGGTRAALQRLSHFVTHHLADYPKQRNRPETDGTSRLSPYLHFGHISPLTIALAVEQAIQQGHATPAARDAFFNELIGWRELSVNFVRHVSNYDSIECAPEWAQNTLREHANDRRDPEYSLDQLERAETYDDLWNAAQTQMANSGWMHNYLRMYWAKKILEWSPNPAAAWEYAVILNDKYELDGRDPNGYHGIAWAIGGVHDRPWFDRPIFGTVRYMSRASTGKKFNSNLYIRQVS
jgi:deoxyribodipyrimidine photo-lyase